MNRYRHMVIFNLKSAKDDDKTKAFLSDGERLLTSIPGVQNFSVFHQISPKNSFTYGFTMDFDSEQEFINYANHPIHLDFVKNRWDTEVSDFLELDFNI